MARFVTLEAHPSGLEVHINPENVTLIAPANEGPRVTTVYVAGGASSGSIWVLVQGSPADVRQKLIIGGTH